MGMRALALLALFMGECSAFLVLGTSKHIGFGVSVGARALRSSLRSKFRHSAKSFPALLMSSEASKSSVNWSDAVVEAAKQKAIELVTPHSRAVIFCRWPPCI